MTEPRATCLDVGNVVKAKNAAYGGENGQMVVSKTFDDDSTNNVECRWWDGERFLRARFCPDELQRIWVPQ